MLYATDRKAISLTLLQRTGKSPTLEFDWVAHEAAIVSIEYVEHEHGTFVLSASTDQTAKLWSLQGQCVGTFGQVCDLSSTPETAAGKPQAHGTWTLTLPFQRG